jgi:hypothetical protein
VANQQVDRLAAFRNESPRAGMEFPEFTAELLDGGQMQLSALAGKNVVLETGSYT